MKSSKKISSVKVDNKKRQLCIKRGRDEMSLPYGKLSSSPNSKNPIVDIYVDKELASEAVTFELQDGTIDSVPLDAFLDFNQDPEYLRTLELYNMTLKAEELLRESGMSKRAITRRMETSMSQLNRLLDSSNNQKSIDQMMKLLTILGATVKVEVA